MNKDYNGDGTLGAMYYNRGHITFRKNILGHTLTVIAVLGMAFVITVIVGALFYSKPAQNVLDSVIAGIEHIRKTQ